MTDGLIFGKRISFWIKIAVAVIVLLILMSLLFGKEREPETRELPVAEEEEMEVITPAPEPVVGEIGELKQRNIIMTYFETCDEVNSLMFCQNAHRSFSRGSHMEFTYTLDAPTLTVGAEEKLLLNIKYVVRNPAGDIVYEQPPNAVLSYEEIVPAKNYYATNFAGSFDIPPDFPTGMYTLEFIVSSLNPIQTLRTQAQFLVTR